MFSVYAYSCKCRLSCISSVDKNGKKDVALQQSGEIKIRLAQVQQNNSVDNVTLISPLVKKKVFSWRRFDEITSRDHSRITRNNKEEFIVMKLPL